MELCSRAAVTHLVGVPVLCNGLTGRCPGDRSKVVDLFRVTDLARRFGM